MNPEQRQLSVSMIVVGILYLLLLYSAMRFDDLNNKKTVFVKNNCTIGLYSHNSEVITVAVQDMEYWQALETFNHEWAHHTYWKGKGHFCEDDE